MKWQMHIVILSIFFSEKDKGCHATETEHIDLDFYIELKLKKKKSHLKITNRLTPRSD